MLQVGIRDVSSVSCIASTSIPPGVSLDDAELSTRSRNALVASGLLNRPSSVAACTYGDLLHLPSVGLRSAIEISCVLEWVVEAQSVSVNQVSAIAPSGDQAEWISTLIEADTESWIDQVRNDDPRFRKVVPPGAGTLHERIERLLSEVAEQGSVNEGIALAKAMAGIRLRVAQISALKLEDALSDVLSAFGSYPRFTTALVARFGWDGSPPRTLEECAAPLGVTRERVRQVESKTKAGLKIGGAFMPRLDAAIQCIESAVPIPVQSVPSKLLEAGVSERAFSIESLLSAATLFGRKTYLTLADFPQGKVVLGRPDAGKARGVARTARRLAGLIGVANVFHVCSDLGESDDESTVENVRRLLRGLEGFEFLDDDWFWCTDLPTGRNRLDNVAHKILSVASPQTVASVRDGVKRKYSFISKSRNALLPVPPISALCAYFTRSPEFRLDRDSVASVQRFDCNEILGSVEAAFVAIFRAVPSGILDRRSVIEACLQRGLNESTVQTFLTYSPILEHVDSDAWKLRGVHVDPAALEALREANQTSPREKRVLSFGWTQSGSLWLASRLPYNLASVVIGVPGALRRYLESRSFAAFERTTGQSCGTLSINAEGTSYGYATFIRRSGADALDVLYSEFDLQRDTVQLSLADENALEEDTAG